MKLHSWNFQHYNLGKSNFRKNSNFDDGNSHFDVGISGLFFITWHQYASVINFVMCRRKNPKILDLNHYTKFFLK